MATTQHLLLSPAELAYLHGTLGLAPPIRPDGRAATQFRPLTAETGILPGTNGSARVCFADGTEAVVGVKAEVERTRLLPHLEHERRRRRRQRQQGTVEKEREREEDEDEDDDDDDDDENNGDDDDEGTRQEGEEKVDDEKATGDDDWVEMTVEVPGYRDDDSSTVFLATMLSEALLADGEFTKKLWINRRFHWKLYLDVILISPPLSYPLPLLSLTTHLALLATRLPRLKSEADEDPMFDDDWAASRFVYPRQEGSASSPPTSRPPITLLVMAVGDNIIFDPSKEELAVADSALAVSVGESSSAAGDSQEEEEAAAMDVDGEGKTSRILRLLSVRTIDPPSRLTAPGVPNAVNAAAWGQGAPAAKDPGARTAETDDVEGVWKAPRGGAKMAVLGAMVQKVLEKGGVADEVLEGLDAVELG